jgi:hypothetical protein
MTFGSGGMSDDQTTRFVPNTQNGLFAPIPGSSKSAFAVIDPNIPTQVTFTVVLDFTDDTDSGAGQQINEMALVMNSGDFYSMTTFPTLTKTSAMQVTWLWRLSFI